MKTTSNIFYVIWVVYLAPFLLSMNCQSDRQDFQNKPTPLFFEVKGHSKVVYLLGTIHNHGKEVLTQQPILKKKFKQSDYLLLETKCYQKVNEELNDLLKKKDEGHFKGKQDSYRYDDLKSLCNGIEYSLEEEAIGRRIETVSLELNCESLPGDIESLLRDKLNNDTSAIREAMQAIGFCLGMWGKAFKEMILYWERGDAQAMIKHDDNHINECIAAIALPPSMKTEVKNIYNQLVLYERNEAMADTIAANYLDQNRAVFAVVGVAHLIGEKSIIEVLRSKGYTVTQVVYP